MDDCWTAGVVGLVSRFFLVLRLPFVFRSICAPKKVPIASCCVAVFLLAFLLRRLRPVESNPSTGEVSPEARHVLPGFTEFFLTCSCHANGVFQRLSALARWNLVFNQP